MSITDNNTAWVPENAGDSVTGKVASLEYVDHDGGGRYEPRRVLVVTVDQGGQRSAIWSWHTVLNQKLHELRPAVGETLTVTYRGRVAPKKAGGQAWANYDASIAERPAAEFTWAEQTSVALFPDQSAEPELPTTPPDDEPPDDDDGIPY
jgi:hypothetical protein